MVEYSKSKKKSEKLKAEKRIQEIYNQFLVEQEEQVDNGNRASN